MGACPYDGHALTVTPSSFSESSANLSQCASSFFAIASSSLRFSRAALVFDPRSLGRRDHPVQPPLGVLPLRVRPVDGLAEPLFHLLRSHLSSRLDPFQLELAELPPAKRRPAAIALPVALEHVDEA